MQIDVAGQLLEMEAGESGALGGQTNKTAQEQGWSVGCSALAGGTVAETGCGRSCLLLPYQEVRVAEFHCGNHKSSKLYVQLRTGGKTGFLKGTTGKSKAMLK